MDVFYWIKRNLNPRVCDSVEFSYDGMDSQSERSLPVIYRPFDPHSKPHWRDRGFTLDFLYSAGGGRLLDFGPGDGWPSLNVAAYADEVVGVEGSKRRVEVCRENAERLGVENVTFLRVSPGTRLPFPDCCFDGVVAASSVEQTPDPRFALEELHRVLRPGGRLRVFYEALGTYRNGREREIWLNPVDRETAQLILCDRHIDEERADQFKLVFNMPVEELRSVIADESGEVAVENIKVEVLEELQSTVTDAYVCSLYHPSGTTLASWLKDVGFEEVFPSESGADAAGSLFDELAPQERPDDIESVDAMIKPVVKKAVRTPAPLRLDPMITASK
jgi:SAM-dependent methyltransferase